MHNMRCGDKGLRCLSNLLGAKSEELVCVELSKT